MKTIRNRMRQMAVYLDCASTTPIDPRVRDEVLRCMEDDFGNAASRTHEFGHRARRAVEHARDQVCSVVGAGRGDVVFTSGATESNNLALLGLASLGRKQHRTHLVSTRIEHHAVLEPLHQLRQQGFCLDLISPTAGGWIDPEAVRQALREDTLLVSVMHANNETGVLQPIPAIADALADHPAFFHVDAAQTFARELEALKHPRIDLISLSGHKIHAPKGVGALITRRRHGNRPALKPIMHGGGQERGLRPGTLAVPLIAGLGLAAELALREADERSASCRRFRQRLVSALSTFAPHYNGDQDRTLPHIINLSFSGLSAEDVIEALRDEVAISNGSACTSAATACSHVLGAMRLSPAEAEWAVRWSWCHMTPEPDWAKIAENLGRLIANSAATTMIEPDHARPSHHSV